MKKIYFIQVLFGLLSFSPAFAVFLEKDLIDSPGSSVNYVEELPDGRWLALGRKVDGPSSGLSLQLLSRTGDIDSSWDFSVSGTDSYVYPSGLELADDGDWIVAFRYTGSLAIPSQPVQSVLEAGGILRMSPEGTVDWLLQLPSVRGIDLALSGEIYAVGVFDSAVTIGTSSYVPLPQDFNQGDAFIARIAANGSVVWSRVFQQADNPVWAGMVEVADESSIAVAGYAVDHSTAFTDFTDSTPSRAGFILRMGRANGEAIWFRGAGDFLSNATVSALEAGQFGDVYVAGRANSGMRLPVGFQVDHDGRGTDGYIYKLTASGSYSVPKALASDANDGIVALEWIAEEGVVAFAGYFGDGADSAGDALFADESFSYESGNGDILVMQTRSSFRAGEFALIRNPGRDFPSALRRNAAGDFIITGSRGLSSGFGVTSGTGFLAATDFLNPASAFFLDSPKTDSRWRQTDYLGSLWTEHFPFIYHPDLQWSYLWGGSEAAFFLYDPVEGVLFTGSDYYPFLYSADRGYWMYHQVQSAGGRQFYLYDPVNPRWIVSE